MKYHPAVSFKNLTTMVNVNKAARSFGLDIVRRFQTTVVYAL